MASGRSGARQADPARADAATSSTAALSSRRPPSQGRRDALKGWYIGTDDPNALMIVPLASTRTGSRSPLDRGASTRGTRDRGRGWLATHTKFDKGALEAFVKEHRYRGRSGPPDRLAPGTEATGPGRVAVADA